jgi:hypothetical protein
MTKQTGENEEGNIFAQSEVPFQNSTAGTEETRESARSGHKISGRNSNTGPTKYGPGLLPTLPERSRCRLHTNNGERRFHVG